MLDEKNLTVSSANTGNNKPNIPGVLKYRERFELTPGVKE